MPRLPMYCGTCQIHIAPKVLTVQACQFKGAWHVSIVLGCGTICNSALRVVCGRGSNYDAETLVTHSSMCGDLVWSKALTGIVQHWTGKERQRLNIGHQCLGKLRWSDLLRKHRRAHAHRDAEIRGSTWNNIAHSPQPWKQVSLFGHCAR